ncbi:hypothetical protein SFB9_0278 [Klebsiella michiganensis]|nr:hypothetical protein SFB9_0278 [Klebsiella michiganensis]
MFLRPGLRDPAFHHRGNGALHPQRSVNMHHDHHNQRYRREGVQHQREADNRDGEGRRKVRTPDDHAAHQQQHQEDNRRPEHAFLAEVIVPGVAHFLVDDNLANIFRPENIVPVDQVVVPVAEEHDDERSKHNHAHERVQNTRQLRGAHDVHQPVEGREEKAQSAHCRQHEAEGGDPVVDSLRRGVAHDGVTSFHLRTSSFSSSRLSSSSSARFGPTPT